MYEGLEAMCGNCKTYGHRSAACLKIPRAISERQEKKKSTASVSQVVRKNDGFGHNTDDVFDSSAATQTGFLSFTNQVLEEEPVRICNITAESITEVPMKLSGPGGMDKVTMEEEPGKSCYNASVCTTKMEEKHLGSGGMIEATIMDQQEVATGVQGRELVIYEVNGAGHHVGAKSDVETNIDILKCNLTKGVDSNMVGEEKAHANNLECVTSGREGEELPIVDGVIISGVEKERDRGTGSSEPMISTEENGSPTKNGGLKKRGRPLGSGKAKVKVGISGILSQVRDSSGPTSRLS